MPGQEVGAPRFRPTPDARRHSRPHRHSREGGNPGGTRQHLTAPLWIPAFAGMTGGRESRRTRQDLTAPLWIPAFAGMTERDWP